MSAVKKPSIRSEFMARLFLVLSRNASSRSMAVFRLPSNQICDCSTNVFYTEFTRFSSCLPSMYNT